MGHFSPTFPDAMKQYMHDREQDLERRTTRDGEKLAKEAHVASSRSK